VRIGAYSRYQDTGIEWLGRIPEHWQLKQIKRISPVKRGASPRPIDDPKYFDDNGDYAWVRIADVSAATDYLETTTQRLSKLGSSLSVKLEPGSLFVSIAGTVGKPCISRIKACIHDGFVYFPKLSDDPRFLLYIFLGGGAFAGLGKLGTQLNLNTETVGGIVIGVPPRNEQVVIADFLDRETAKIDGLIAKQAELLAMLDEHRRAMVTEAVTHGLDASVSLQKAGIEGLPEVPAHWQIRSLSSISTKITNGYVGPTRDILVADGVTYLQSLHIKSNRITFDGRYFVRPEWSKEHAKSILRQGDVLIVQTGDIGQVAVVPPEYEGANCHALIVVAPSTRHVTGKFLSWVLNSDYGYFALKSVETGALHPHLNCGNVKFIKIPVPPLDEQALIVAHIEAVLAKHDSFTRVVITAIENLHEHRSALITAAVTGKIDVGDPVLNKAAA
jgi:type I restriction enzyme S subunit